MRTRFTAMTLSAAMLAAGAAGALLATHAIGKEPAFRN